MSRLHSQVCPWGILFWQSNYEGVRLVVQCVFLGFTGCTWRSSFLALRL